MSQKGSFLGWSNYPIIERFWVSRFTMSRGSFLLIYDILQ